MKKNLLITLGDSWTRGVGCGLTTTPGIRDRKSFPSEREYQNYVEEIHKLEDIYGWAPVCANLLDYDLINIAVPSWSNPALVKTIIDDVKYAKYKTQYERVVLVYLLTDPHRFGLFTNIDLQNITVRGFGFWENSTETRVINDIQDFELTPLPNPRRYERPKEINHIIWKTYIDYMIPVGSIRETVFHLRCMEHFCKSCGYEFYWGTAFTPYQELYPYYKEINNCLHHNEFESFRTMIFNKHKLNAFAPCAHPNELGYEEIAKYIFNKLKI